MCQDPIWAPVLIPAASLPIQLVSWESSREWPKALGTCTCVGDLEEEPGSWLRIGTAPAIVFIWGVNHLMEELPLCLSSSLYIWLCNKNKSLKGITVHSEIIDGDYTGKTAVIMTIPLNVLFFFFGYVLLKGKIRMHCFFYYLMFLKKKNIINIREDLAP